MGFVSILERKGLVSDALSVVFFCSCELVDFSSEFLQQNLC